MPTARQLFRVSCFMIGVSLLASCQMFSAVTGNGSRDPLYKFPPGKRILVFVDVRPDLSVPPEFSSLLGQRISDQLYQYKAAEKIVAQSRLTELRRDPDKFSRMGIADIARATESDIVLHVDLITFSITSLSDESITQGVAQVLVKVVDHTGRRMWPPSNTSGAGLEARVDPALTEQRDKPAVQREIVNLLALRISRNFYKIDLNDPQMTK